MFQIPRVTKTTRNDDNQMIEFKIQIKDFYLSYLLVKVDAKNKIEDIVSRCDPCQRAKAVLRGYGRLYV